MDETDYMNTRADRQQEKSTYSIQPSPRCSEEKGKKAQKYKFRKKHLPKKSNPDDYYSLKIRDEHGEVIGELTTGFILDNLEPLNSLQKGTDTLCSDLLHQEVLVTMENTLSDFIKRLLILLHEATRINADEFLVSETISQLIKLHVPRILVAHAGEAEGVVNFHRILEKVSSIVLSRKNSGM